jgi:radical SAM superfamily enzyme YgiQ (UPF0313 family)
MAASRTTCENPGELTMKVLLISGNREDVDIRVPALGLACIAAATAKDGHDVRLLDLLSENDPQKAVAEVTRDFRPEVIGVSVRNIDDQRMRNPRFLLDQARETVGWCRSLSASPIVLGGAGFSILPQPILEYLGADMGIQGEGETVFVDLLKKMGKNASPAGLPGLFQRGAAAPARRAFIKDLDSLPLPAPTLLAGSLACALDAPVPVQTRRGCPLSCSYCSTPTIEGRSVRWRSQESIVHWLKQWVDNGFRKFYFVDNTFNLPPSYAINLCLQIIAAGLNISWRCILFPGALDPKMIETMARAGCKEVSLGFESGSQSILRGMNKHYSVDEVRRACDLLHRHGIRRMGFLLLGGPGETRETVRESLSFAESLDLDAVRLSAGIRIYPETDVARRAKTEGMISSDADLLFPKFYVARDLEEWLYDTLAQHLALKPNWTY